MAACGGVLWGLLGAAAMLTPDPRGWGTHEQLGLPPCTFALMFHMRCPSCGMTTAWAHVAHGQLVAAVAANTCGALLAVAAAVGGGWCLASAARGRWLVAAPSERAVAWGAVGLVGLVLLEWGVRLLARPG